MTSLSDIVDLSIFGPRPSPAELLPARAVLNVPPTLVAAWRRRFTWLRYFTGAFQYEVDSRLGSWLATELRGREWERGYFFTQIARESLVLARSRGASTFLDNPNGHIRDFRERLCSESERWTGWPFLGHPSESMVRRVEHEYRLADRIRVSSHWAKRRMVDRGVDATKIVVVPPIVDVNKFTPGERGSANGPLRLVFVGSISLGKGFQYLLRAIARLGARHFQLEMVGATGDPWCRRLLERLTIGLNVVHAPGDPVSAYQRGELFVLPTLHDGFGLVVGEAMACGLPVMTTDSCGAAEWIVPGDSGWVLPAGDEEALVTALEGALTRRRDLEPMGMVARRTADRLNDETCRGRLARCVAEHWRLSDI
jgi:glycosyltransferase involved in cell wall biosynthesis